MNRENLETATGRLFGQLWAPFNDDLFAESVALFGNRLDLAGFDASWFQGKICLDAGCGGGRNSIAMARLGASQVKGIDLGIDGLKDARKRAESLGHENISFDHASILDIPFDDNTFDMVWCAGVMMITDDAERALDELTRVLKPGGKLYLLVYATEGIRWPLILTLRPIANLIGLERMEEAIEACSLPANKRRTFLDDLFCPKLDFYDWPRLRRMLDTREMSNIDRWADDVRLDHEHSLDCYITDLQYLERMFRGGESLKDEVSRTLFFEAADLVGSTIRTIETARKLESVGKLPAAEVMKEIIGQGHHRVVSTKS
jgi:SAM-dependent methyltransferase